MPFASVTVGPHPRGACPEGPRVTNADGWATNPDPLSPPHNAGAYLNLKGQLGFGLSMWGRERHWGLGAELHTNNWRTVEPREPAAVNLCGNSCYRESAVDEFTMAWLNFSHDPAIYWPTSGGGPQ